jgi:hypothetical protein
LQLASTCSLSPPFFCPPKHSHTATYKHRILCNINWVCYEGHITTIRAEEACRYSITNREINEWLAPAIRSALSQNLHPAHCDVFSTLLTPDTCAWCVVVVYMHVRESWGQKLRVCECECAGLQIGRHVNTLKVLSRGSSDRISVMTFQRVHRTASLFIKWKQQRSSHCFLPCSFLVQISAQCPVS